jgi:cytochrome c peroxidase
MASTGERTRHSPSYPSLRARLAAILVWVVLGQGAFVQARAGDKLDAQLVAALAQAGFTGRIESTLEPRLGRRIDPKLANLGRLLWFDKITGLHNDNNCAGCHSPTNGFGDTQSIAIGVQNNNLVGPDRAGPRNQRRTPMAINTAFYPKLMWNGRFSSLSEDPFDNSRGYLFPQPEGTTRFPPGDPNLYHLLVAQAHMPPTEQIEVAGFTGTGGIFDDGLGSPVPPPDPATGSRDEPIRQAVLNRLNATPNYRALFGARFAAVRRGGPITFVMFGQAIAEFEFTLTFADAPIDRYARGDPSAMTGQQKRGALLFFGEAGCVRCHAVAGPSNEMFSDFQMHVLGVPQIAPVFGVGTGNFAFSGPGADEDFGLEDFTGDPADRYRFRTSPLRNLALQPAFFHNGCFARLEDAVSHHLDVIRSAREYDPVEAGIDRDLTHREGPLPPVLRRLDPLLRTPTPLSDSDFDALVAFLREALLDPRATPAHLLRLIPPAVPSGMPVLDFEF